MARRNAASDGIPRRLAGKLLHWLLFGAPVGRQRDGSRSELEVEETVRRPSRPLLLTTVACAATGVALPYIPPLAHLFGFTPLPAGFLGILAAMIVTYLALVQVGVKRFFRPTTTASPSRRQGCGAEIPAPAH
jgi:hypothetical protein